MSQFNGTLTQNSKTVWISAPKDYSGAAATAEWID